MAPHPSFGQRLGARYGTRRPSYASPMEPRESPTTSAYEHVSMPGVSQNRRLRVLVIGVSWPLETFIERLLTGLAAGDNDLTLLRLGPKSSRPSADWLDRNRIEWLDEATATIRSVASESFRNPAHAWSFVTRQLRGRLGRSQDAASIVRAGDWDVIYAPWINALTDHPELFSGATPVVTSCRGALVSIAPWDPSRPEQGPSLARAFKTSVLVHCVSDAIVLDAIEMGLDPAKAQVIRPAVDPAAFRPSQDRISTTGLLRVIGVGTLNWRKDYETALVAVQRAVEQGVDVQLDLVGDGPDRQHLAFTIQDLGLTDRVRLLGRRTATAVAELLEEADVFLHTSSSEGISNAVLEAMATAMPVITTDSGGMREAVRDGVDGFVLEVRDTDGIASALVELAEDPCLRSRMGSAARQRIVDDFQLTEQVRSFADLLNEAAGR